MSEEDRLILLKALLDEFIFDKYRHYSLIEEKSLTKEQEEYLADLKMIVEILAKWGYSLDKK